jgi:hypothetical protein
MDGRVMEPLEPLERIEDKIDKLIDSLALSNISIAKQDVLIDTLAKRTLDLEDRLLPVEKDVLGLHAAFKLIGVCATLGTVGLSFAKILSLFFR